jgi:hypothetical protein
VFFTTQVDNGDTTADSETRDDEVGQLLQYDDSYPNPLIVARRLQRITRMAADCFEVGRSGEPSTRNAERL